ncbi:unnamed protein product [Aspergillus oryzae]|uniref:Unnamed protein product n=1 Tax=Aspergillus oryzae TaxID=5062 RepID=A0AAN5C4D8_ASPOZ|nr:unnamed protein product [Aspergillus oryzae]
MTAIHRDGDAKEGTPFVAFNTPVPVATAKYQFPYPKLQPEEHTVTATPTTSTKPAAIALTAPGATPAQGDYQCCPGPKFHPSCYSSGPYVGVFPTPAYCPKVPYLVEEDRKFWFHAPNGDCMHLTVKQIAEKQCAGHWVNTCAGQPYYVCLPKDRIRYDAKDFNAVFQMSGLSHIEFHKRYQPF